MATSLIYRSALGYELLMRGLYGRHYGARLSAVAEQVSAGSSVLELCCGPGTLYRRYLRAQTKQYIGLDVNERFVAQLRRASVDARSLDLADVEVSLPIADVVIMQASLYHFLPDAAQILERMLDAAQQRVIIAEPVRNLATSDHRWARAIARRGTDPGVGGHAARFTEATLDQLMSRWAGQIIASFLIPGGREKVYVLAGGG
ncbi:MAG: class I SAM-dependent methyltransferase [Solirubrobacteraceae bacterium]